MLIYIGQCVYTYVEIFVILDADPNNYVGFYRRGTVYLGMGKFKSAQADLTRVLELKPDFDSARMQRANVLLKKGLFNEAIEDFQRIVSYKFPLINHYRFEQLKFNSPILFLKS